MFRETKKKKLLLALLTAAVLAFIWGNSCLSAESSGEISDGIGALLTRLFGEVSIFIIRKLGHFSEFAALGFLISWQAALWTKKAGSGPVLLSLLCAMTDETIQLFSPGRASQVRDVWIDLAGILTGWLLIRLLSRSKGRR